MLKCQKELKILHNFNLFKCTFAEDKIEGKSSQEQAAAVLWWLSIMKE